MAGTNKVFVGTSGTLVVANPGKVALETDESRASDLLGEGEAESFATGDRGRDE